MAKIKAKDLSLEKRLGKRDLKKIRGGGVRGACNATGDGAWTPISRGRRAPPHPKIIPGPSTMGECHGPSGGSTAIRG